MTTNHASSIDYTAQALQCTAADINELVESGNYDELMKMAELAKNQADRLCQLLRNVEAQNVQIRHAKRIVDAFDRGYAILNNREVRMTEAFGIAQSARREYEWAKLRLAIS